MMKLLNILFIVLTLLTSLNCSIMDIRQKLIKKSSETSIKKGNITILMMFPDIDYFIPNLKSLLVVYEYIVHQYQISKWLDINLQVKDSNCSISLAPHQLVETMLSTIPDVVFGPFCGLFYHYLYFYFQSIEINRFSSCTCCSSSPFSKYSSYYNGSCFK